MCSGGGGGGGIDGTSVGGSSGSCGVGDSGERVLRGLCIGVVEVVGVLWTGVVEVDCTRVVDIVLGGGFFGGGGGRSGTGGGVCC